jgi:hypothetical protein
MVNPTNPSICNLIHWPPQTELPRPTSVPQTAPVAGVLPSASPLANLATVTVQVLDAEGNASTPFLQFQFSGATNWQDATVTTLDGAPYASTLRVAALPTGVSHTLIWNALTNLGPGVTTNVYLRARARDITLLGDWSAGTPFTVQTTANPDSDGDGLPDAWEIQYFGSVSANPNDDPDGDGFRNWQEYVADTNPTNAASYLRITGLSLVPEGLRIEWQGGILATQYLQSLADLGTNTWENLFTSSPPTPILGSFTNAPGTNVMQFYRLKATR